METIHFVVRGMSCPHCSEEIKKHLQNMQGVKDVSIDLWEQTVSVDGHNLNKENLGKQISAMGYQVM